MENLLKFNGLIIISILTIFNIVRLHGDRVDTDLQKLKDIMKEFKSKATIINAKVIMDNEEVSIQNYYDTKTYDSEVKKHEIYKVFHILNIALSCEYSKISYLYIKSIDNYFSPCITKVKEASEWFDGQLKVLNECFIKYHSTYLDYLLEHTQSMVLSLASLVEYTKNVMFKNHEILRILLSWNAFLHQIKMTKDSPEKYEERLKRLESIMMTNIQMKHRLERFLVKNCYRRDKLKTFITHVDRKIEIDFETLLNLKGEKIKNLSSPLHERITNKFVINTLNTNFETLFYYFIKELESRTIPVEWNNSYKDIKEIYNNEIKTTSDIMTIVQFEKKLLEVLYEIIVWQEIKALRVIMKKNRKEDILNRLNSCNVLVKNIKNYIGRKKLESYHDQPIDLIKFLFHNKKALSYLCSLMADEENNTVINNEINSMEKKLKYVSRFIGTTKLGTFLDGLSKIVISAKLHPVILNTFWEQSIVYDSLEVRFYGVEYQYLHTKYNKSAVDNYLCKITLEPMKMLKSLQNQIIGCIGVSDKINCFSSFREQYDQVIIKIAFITANTYQPYLNDWEKMLLTLIQNKENIESFDPEKQETVNDTRLEHLITFLYNMENLLLEKVLVKCICDVFFSNFQQIGYCTNPLIRVSRYLKEDIKDITELSTIRKLEGVIKYKRHIQYITEHVESLLEVYNSKAHCTMYWDGIPSNLNEVHANYQKYMFDIQDAYDYTSYFIKWVLSIPFTKLILLLFNGLDEKNLKYIIREQIIKVKTSIKNFLKIDLLRHASIEYYFEDFFIAIELLYDGRKQEAADLILDIFDEFRFINIIERIDHSELYYNWVAEFSSEIDLLMIVFGLKSDARIISAQ